MDLKTAKTQAKAAGLEFKRVRFTARKAPAYYISKGHGYPHTVFDNIAKADPEAFALEIQRSLRADKLPGY